jgi:F-type H+-transporting ATPase subunit gamma
MSESTSGLRRQISSATDLQSVVRTMRALAASNIGHYEQAVAALIGYDRTIELGLGVCLRAVLGDGLGPATSSSAGHTSQTRTIGAIVFGSDQGLVGPFNDTIAEHAVATLSRLPVPAAVWVVGERVAARLAEAGIRAIGVYAVPTSVEAIDTLVGRLQVDVETHPSLLDDPHLLVFHNQPLAGALYEPIDRGLLPLDAAWRTKMTHAPWPARSLPEVVGDVDSTLRALVREYLFVSLYRACAESLASENASRLAAMQRADKSIDDLLESLRGRFARLRQGSIDAELFDVTAGYEALSESIPDLPGPC